tara:strand:- start:1394 stop:1864 length:471 start_codon:yes stop_codon:yes gene_type:complete
MVTFRNNNNNNNRRNNFRRIDRSYKSSGERQKFSSNFSNNDNFKRKSPGRNNHNAAKLIEKYNDLAREASSHGDKILSENYLQHADHFTRIHSERESFRKEKYSENLENKTENNEGSQEVVGDTSNQIDNKNMDITKENLKKDEVKKSAKSIVDIS